MQKKWMVYGLVVMLGVISVAPAQAFFNPGRWMNPSEWFGNNNHNYGPPPPRPMPPQAYPPAYGQPAPYAYPAAPTPAAAPTAPAPAAPSVIAPAPFAPAVAAPAPTPPTTYTAPASPTEYKANNPVFAPSTSSSGLKWPDEKSVSDSLQNSQSFSFAPSGYLQGSDDTK